ncbi:homeobox-leucine zipper protein ROC3-like [Andrographis paniculata]|uniref:homeobox-leucine zipper protein ROC3-like n=1 Tax=Andrographis paniculata TaxID=175694 RepID=UPI0021E96EE7|nr:homeobox-leucine zipper protein ROC3-like [Andrographis paniculata]XP_051114582.1 homeobox-leucine zipper protein ROC3-like [Andrographis paniculata]XP_051114583.1 homeobox-leucine zipper protein ROC3-like [Andrographis paniculata]
MYGDCQVLSSMGGNAIPSDNSLYSSPNPVQNNPNFNFMSSINPFGIFSQSVTKEESAIGKGKEEMESGGSGSEPAAEIDQDTEEQPPPNKKKRYHRHTARQIQEMEAMFKENPHPDDKQRQRLSQELGLKPRQVKFWFQNRRTQTKAQQDRQDNVVLRAENENMKKENYRLQVALRNISCPNCGGPAMLGEMGYDEQQLRIENARLKEELDRVCCLVAPYADRPPNPLLESSLDLDMAAYSAGKVLDHQDPVTSCPNSNDQMMPLPFLPENSQFPGANECLIMEEEKTVALELAASAMAELIKMQHTGEPLWIPIDDGSGRPAEMLNIDEYSRMFSNVLKLQAEVGLRTEASRDTAVVIMNSITLADAFMDANKWMELFPCIISRARTLQVVHQNASGQADGCLLLMFAEVQFLSPLVATREAHFLRYCRHNADEGSWAIVDFPLDGLHAAVYPPSFPYYHRRPSGCIIQDMPNGYSRVTWIEHAEVEDGPIHHVFHHLVTSGAAFGARRWLAILRRQCESLASLMARSISDLGVIPSPEARRNLMNLAERMMMTFCGNISASSGQSWMALSHCDDDDTVRITTRKAIDPSQPNGLILSAVSTTWLPYQHARVFDFLRDEKRRVQLEVLSTGNSLQEVAHIANGSHPGNCISLLRINVSSNSSQTVELVLQESSSDESGSMVVYSTINVDALQLAMNGEDPSCIPLLPLGFIVVPSPKPAADHPAHSGSLLTVGLQVLASTSPTAKLNISSVAAINQHLSSTVKQIGAALENAAAADTPPEMAKIRVNDDPAAGTSSPSSLL